MKKTTRKETREKESKINFFAQFIKIRDHFFSGIVKELKSVKDVRHQSYIDYTPDILLFVILMKNICCVESMNDMTKKFNKDECIENIAAALGYKSLEDLPHYSTINNFLCKLETNEIEKIRDYMIHQLFKKRCLENNRLLNRYWCVAIDATGLFSFSKKHCDHCLKKEYKDKVSGEIIRTEYYHNVLEAKLIIGEMVFSIGTEFIENEDENVTKQDCEINAFKRLAPILKKAYSRLPICILADSLYAAESVFKICDSYNWKFLIRFKEGSIKSIAEEFKQLKEFDGSRDKNCVWVRDIAYNERTVNLIEMEIEEETTKKSFVFLTNIPITIKNAEKIASAGRSRWKIENQGFNNQKTKTYIIEHANSLNYNAMKIHYLLTQIADIIRQLFDNGVEEIKTLKKGIQEISACLLESFRTQKVTLEDILTIDKRLKVRLL